MRDWIKHNLMAFIAIILVSGSVIGAGVINIVPSDNWRLGIGSSSDDKVIEIDTNDGASNPKIVIDMTDKDFDFSAAVNIAGDLLKLGDGTNSDKVIEFDIGASPNNPRFRWSTTNSAIEFSNDGIVFKKIGSGTGGGGGQNFFTDNPDAEAGTNNWTNIGGGTFTTNSVTPINGDNDFQWDASASGDILRTDQVDIPEKFKGKACQIEFTYTGGTDDLVKPQVVDSSNVKLPGATYANQVDGTDFLKAQTGIVTRSIFFLCPSTGTIAFEFNQTAAGDPAVMNFDDVFIGELKGLQSTVLDQGEWQTFTPSGIVGHTGNTELEGFWRQDGTDIIVKMTWLIGAVNGSAFQVDLPAGFTIDFAAESSENRSNLGLASQLHNGATIIASGNTFVIFTDGVDNNSVFISEVGTGDVMSKAAGNEIGAVGRGFSMEFRIAVNEVTASPVLIYNSIPTVAQNVNNFSARVDGSNGNIISKNTNFDLSCTRNGTGDYACTYNADNIFTVIPSITCGVSIPDSASNGDSDVCRIEDLGLTTFDVLISDAFAGQEVDLNHVIRFQKQTGDFKLPVVQPILVNQIQTSKTSGAAVESCLVDNNGTATLNSDSTLCESWIDSVTRTALGLVTIDISSGVFGQRPNCVAGNLDDLGNNVFCDVTDTFTSNTQVQVRCNNPTPANFDRPFTIICMGAR
jgi:hypothetical protein